MDYVGQARTARRLAEDLSVMASLAAELADAAVWRATRDEPAEAVAAALGVSVPTVRKAIRLHNHRAGGKLSDAASAESDRTN